MSRGKRITVVAGIVAVVGAAVTFWGIRELHERDHRPRTVKSGVLYRCMQPDPLRPEELAKRNIVRVVDLRARSEDPNQFDAEQAVCRQAGAQFINLPIGGVLPSDEQLETFLRAVTSGQGATLVHCAQGRSRTGIMSAAFLVVVENYTPEQALADMLAHGDKSDPDNIAQKKALLVRLHHDRAVWLARISQTTSTQAK